MATITVPDNELIVLNGLDFDAPAQKNRSQYTRRSKTIDLPGGQMWFAAFHVEDIATELDERPWRAFLVSLKGMANKFRLRVACSQHGGSNPTVASGGSGNTLTLSSSIGLKLGQYMTVPLPSGHERLVMLTADMSGATATFLPSLDETPVAGTVVETVNPWLLASLPDSRNGWKLDGGVASFQFNAEEAL